MKDKYISYDQAVKLKKLGFDWGCECFYTTFAKVPLSLLKPYPKWKNWNDTEDKCSAPCLDQVQKWLREAKGIAVNVIAHDGGKWEYDIVFLPNAVETDDDLDRSPWCKTYEEALTEGIDEALKILSGE